MQEAKFRQIAFIYLIGVSCFSAFLLPGAVSVYADTAAVLVPLLSVGISLLFSYILYRNVKRYGSLRRMIALKCGEKFVKVFTFILLLWLCFIAVFYVCALYHRLASTAFGYIPRVVCIAALLLCACLFAFTPAKAIARSGSIVFIIMLFSLFLLLLFCAAGMDVKSLLPVKVNSFTLFLRAFLFPIGCNGLLCFLLFDYEGEVPRLSAFQITVFAGAALISLFLFLIQGVFGAAFSEHLSYPFFALIKSTDSLIKLEHFESLMSGVWIVMSFCFLLALFSMIGTAFKNTVHFKNPKLQLLSGLIPYGVVAVAALLIPDSRFLSEFALGTLMPLGNILLGIIPVCAVIYLPTAFAK